MYTTLKQARKHLDPKDFRQIHKNAEQAVKELKTKETEVIKALQEVDKNKVYRYLGLNSLYQYALAIGLSEHQAYTYITVARKALECNQLQKAIESKEITVSKARRLAAVMDKKNQRSWLSLAGKLSKRELEKEIAKTNPRAIAPEQAKYLTQDVLELSLPVSEEVYNQLKRVQDILCQKNQKTVSLEECLKTLCEFYLDKQDPVRKAERIIGKKSAKARMEPNSTKANTERVSSQTTINKITFNSARAEKGEKQNSLGLSQIERKAIPAEVLHKIRLRDKDQCQYIHPTGQACQESRWVEYHHIKPVSLGGEHKLENLITLCSWHHKVMHEKSYSDVFQK